MDVVLDALLQSLADLVPYTCARVLIPEGGPHVLSLGEKLCHETPKPRSELPLIGNRQVQFPPSICSNCLTPCFWGFPLDALLSGIPTVEEKNHHLSTKVRHDGSHLLTSDGGVAASVG
jgi:hypothetical protein